MFANNVRVSSAHLARSTRAPLRKIKIQVLPCVTTRSELSWWCYLSSWKSLVARCGKRSNLLQIPASTASSQCRNWRNWRMIDLRCDSSLHLFLQIKIRSGMHMSVSFLMSFFFLFLFLLSIAPSSCALSQLNSNLLGMQPHYQLLPAAMLEGLLFARLVCLSW